MLHYRFILKPEMFWFLVITGLTVILQALVELDLDTMTDWRTWGIGLGVGVARAVIGALLATATTGVLTYDDPDKPEI